jgi:hypothetical protein
VSESRWEAGLRFGPEFDPEQYELLEFHHRGGEAEVWRAVRTGHNGVRELVAAKIMLERDPVEVRRWLGRWDDVSHNAHRLAVTDLVVPTFLLGPTPHRPGRPSARGGMLGYQISPWFDGVPLHRWARAHRRDLTAAAEVLARLCRIVDDLHRKRWVHRDISPANVLVGEDGQVKLIDLTFLAPLDHAVTVAVLTPGHAPPEIERVGGLPTTAKDVFAVGTLARALLLPDHYRLDQRDAAVQARGELIAAGFRPGLADWVCEPLDPDPDRRPAPLAPWAARGASLLRDQHELPRINCLDVLADQEGGPLIISGGPCGIGYAGPGAERTPKPPAGGPGPLDKLAAARVGPRGELAVFARDGAGTLWLGSRAGWFEAARGVHGLAGGADHAGELIGWTARAGELRCYRWAPEQTLVGRDLPRCPADRVLAAVQERPGVWLVLAEHQQRAVYWRMGAEPRPERLETPAAAGRVAAAALARTSHGPQATILHENGEVTLHQLGRGDGAPAPKEVSEAESARGAALIGHRAGPTLALAGPGGVRLRAPASGSLTGTGGAGRRPRWWRPTLRPATHTALAVGEDWRLILAAVVEDELQCWQEDADYRWQPVELATEEQ